MKDSDSRYPRYSIYRLAPDRRFFRGADKLDDAIEAVRKMVQDGHHRGVELWDSRLNRPIYAMWITAGASPRRFHEWIHPNSCDIQPLGGRCNLEGEWRGIAG